MLERKISRVTSDLLNEELWRWDPGVQFEQGFHVIQRPGLIHRKQAPSSKCTDGGVSRDAEEVLDCDIMAGRDHPQCLVWHLAHGGCSVNSSHTEQVFEH